MISECRFKVSHGDQPVQLPTLRDRGHARVSRSQRAIAHRYVGPDDRWNRVHDALHGQLRVEPRGSHGSNKRLRCDHAHQVPRSINNGQRILPSRMHTPRRLPDAVPRRAHRRVHAADHLIEQRLVQPLAVIRSEISGRHRILRRDISLGLRILGQQLTEQRGVQRIDHHLGCRLGRIPHFSCPVKPVQADHVPRTVHVAQFLVVPQRHGATLNDEHMRTMRRLLPQQEFVHLVKLHAAARSQRQHVLVVHVLERRMVLQKVGYTMGNGGCLHFGLLQQTGLGGNFVV